MGRPPRPARHSELLPDQKRSRKQERERTNKKPALCERGPGTDRAGETVRAASGAVAGVFCWVFGVFFFKFSFLPCLAGGSPEGEHPAATSHRGSVREGATGVGGQPLSQATSSRQGLVLQASFPGAPLRATSALPCLSRREAGTITISQEGN